MLLLAALIVGILLIGLVPAKVAESKGQSFWLWWFYGVFLFIFALPHAILLSPERALSEKEQLASGTLRKCPFCAELIKSEAALCRFCGRPTAKTV